MQTLDVISINIWQILISLLNLLIIFLLIKKFLYKPIRKFLAQRQDSIAAQYAKAEEAEKAASDSKLAYEEKLSNAQQEAEDIVKNATVKADLRGEKIIADAKEKAEDMVRKANDEIEIEKKKATDEIRKEITDVSAVLTEKLLGREINETDHRGFIDSFIEGMGENND